MNKAVEAKNSSNDIWKSTFFETISSEQIFKRRKLKFRNPVDHREMRVNVKGYRPESICL